MKRGLLLALLALAVIAPVAAQDAPPANLRVHEWGVWRIEHGHVAHLAELAAELPDFVQRVDPRTLRLAPLRDHRPRPNPPPHLTPARKPVIFLHADRDVDVAIDVAFPEGEPWLVHPAPVVTRSSTLHPHLRGTFLRFVGRVTPNGQAPVPSVAPGHFFEDLRRAGGDPFVSGDGTAERFVFYDGLVPTPRIFSISRRPGGAMVSRLSSEEIIFLVDGGRYVESHVAAGNASTSVASMGDSSMLRTRLEEELTTRGLTPAEARSLLETWRGDLFQSTQARAIYFLTRRDYDALLPIAVEPTPTEIVRVGVIIELLDP